MPTNPKHAPTFAFLGALLMICAVALIGYSTVTANSRSCQATAKLDRALVTILNRSLKGLPANPYYRQHPEERDRALRSTRRAIRDLKAASC